MLPLTRSRDRARFFKGLSAVWTPLQLFANNEVGAWYDPSDMSTLYQDSAGTTPVTAIEQPVGLMRDKSGRGNHAYQSTSASRPVLSARVNLLTKTEDFSDAAWVKSPTVPSSFQGTGLQAVITPNYGVAPDGTQTADRVQLNLNGGTTSNDRSGFYAATGSLPIGLVTKNVIYVKPLDGTTAEQILAANIGIAAYSGTAVSQQAEILQDGWLQITRVTPIVIPTGDWRVQIIGGVGRPNSMDLLVWGADFRAANDGINLPAYQRVNTATDYDTVGFPKYLRFDGVDDWLQTNSIDFTATDKMTVWAGVRKTSDAALGIIAELSDVSLNRYFSLAASSAGTAVYRFASQGDGTFANAVSPTSYPAPITNVLTGTGNISGDQAILRLNSTQVAFNTADQGTGNYGNYPLYIGRRGGTTLPFNGRLNSLIIRGAQSSTAQIEAAEAYVNTKTKAYS